MRRIAVLVAALALTLSLFPASTLAAPSASGSWIVTLRAGVDSRDAAPRLAKAHGVDLGFVYRSAINGFSFRGSAVAAAALARNPRVALVETDAEVVLDTTQTSATWGLDRIDQRSLPLDTTYTYDTTGEGVTAYIIDSGIRFSHDEFDGRAVRGTDRIGDGLDGDDCNGHGTHVAGTVGGETYGVAKAARLVSVRIFGCGSSSSWSVIIAGIEWVIDDHAPGEPAVANMSLSGPATSSVDTATNNLIADGVAVVVAAGNGDWLGRQANACNSSPARVPGAMTISATQSNDAKVSWANYGSCVDWFAPGVSIRSAAISSDTASTTKSGTSMAAPHTAGVAALYLDVNPGATPSQVRTALYDATTKGVVTSSSTTNNHLLYSRVTAPTPTNRAPTANDVTASGDEDTTIAWAPSVSDPDVGSTLTCSISSPPSTGTATVAANCGSGTFTPSPDFFGTVTFSYAVFDGSLGDSGTVTVTVNDVVDEPPPAGSITLAARGYKVKGVQHAELSWEGAGSANVDVYRDGDPLLTTPNDGAHVDNLGRKGGGTYTYMVCDAGTSTCSNEVTVSY